MSHAHNISGLFSYIRTGTLSCQLHNRYLKSFDRISRLKRTYYRSFSIKNGTRGAGWNTQSITSSASDGIAARTTNNTTTSQSNRGSLPKKVAVMRARLSELHRLPNENSVKVLSDKAGYDAVSNETDCNTSSDYSNDFHDQADGPIKGDNKDTDFIRSIGKPDRRHSDVYVAMTYGLARFDNMNKPGCTGNGTVSGFQQTAEAGAAKDADVQNAKKWHSGTKPLKKREDTDINVVTNSLTDNQQKVKENNQSETTSNNSQINVFDQQYFNALLSEGAVDKYITKNADGSHFDQPSSEENTDMNLFDEQYFGRPMQRNTRAPVCDTQSDAGIAAEGSHFDLPSSEENTDMNLFDEQYFGRPMQRNMRASVHDIQPGAGIAADENVQCFEQGLGKYESELSSDFTNCVRKPKITKNSVEESDVEESIFDIQYESQALPSNKSKNSSANFSFVAEEQLMSSEKSIINERHENKKISPSQQLSLQDIADSVSKQMAHIDDIQWTNATSLQKLRNSSSLHHVGPKASFESSSSTQTHVLRPSNVVERFTKVKSVNCQSDIDEDTTVVEPVTQRELKAWNRPVANISNPETAYDYAMKLRSEKLQKPKPELARTMSGESSCGAVA
jgi:hypothetical protein